MLERSAGRPLHEPGLNPAARAGGCGGGQRWPASHAAIVAHALGILAMMATAEGSLRLVNGLRVRVDGVAGMTLHASPQTNA
jgi:phosphoenolpyruvate-protein kinase (PTS system EI component)